MQDAATTLGIGSSDQGQSALRGEDNAGEGIAATRSPKRQVKPTLKVSQSSSNATTKPKSTSSSSNKTPNPNSNGRRNPISRTSMACEGCRRIKQGCSGNSPCDRCVYKKVECIFDQVTPNERRKAAREVKKSNKALGIPKSQVQSQAQKSALASTSKVPNGKRLREDGNGKGKRKSNIHDLMNPSQLKESLAPDKEMEVEPDPPPLSTSWLKEPSSSSSISLVKAEEEIVRPASPVGSDSSVSLSCSVKEG